MNLERKVAVGVLVAFALVALVVLMSEEVEERVAPQPKRALIAVSTDDRAVARTGRSEIEPGESFTLHAVVEAVDWRGETVYYTEAEKLEVDGTLVDDDKVRPWDRAVEIRILWFTVEGFKPFLEVEDVSDLVGFHYKEFLRPSWPRTWSIPGSLKGSGDAGIRQEELGEEPRFGTQRYLVRVEIFGPQSRITPMQRLQSLEADSLPETADRFPTVVAAEKGRLDLATSLFGIPQIELQDPTRSDLQESLNAWTEPGLAFSRRQVLKEMIDRMGVAFDDLAWVDIDLSQGPTWGESGVSKGDLLRVGERWVVLFEDRGEMGRIDRQDLCLDFDRGPRVSRVGDVFTGDGFIEWATPASLQE